MQFSAEANELLAQHGAMLVRNRKHQVWRFPDGKTFVRASTPSDVNAVHQDLRALKNLLQLNDPDRGAPGERRDKKANGRTDTPKPHRLMAPTVNGALQEKLLTSGLALRSQQDLTRQWQQRALMLETELRRNQQANRTKRQRLKRLAAHNRPCWWCRLKRCMRVNFWPKPTAFLSKAYEEGKRRVAL